MATGDYTYYNDGHRFIPMGQYQPSMSVGYLYVEPTTITSGWNVCGTCGVWYQIGSLHNCQPPTLTFTSTNRTPHKCPCCDGFGERDVIDPEVSAIEAQKMQCKICYGSGIVWG